MKEKALVSLQSIESYSISQTNVPTLDQGELFIGFQPQQIQRTLANIVLVIYICTAKR